MKVDRDRQLITIDPSQLTGAQFTAIVNAIVQAVPDAEMVADSYNGLVFQRPELVVPAEWQNEGVTP